VVALRRTVREVPGSNLGVEYGYTDRFSVGFAQFL
jgi:hypothetical protein